MDVKPAVVDSYYGVDGAWFWDHCFILTTKYSDLHQLVGFGVQLLMYATPVIYPLSSIEGNWRWLILVNPMTPIVEVFRLAFLGVSDINPVFLLYSVGFTAVVFLAGALIFNHVESTFMDTV